MDSQAIRIVPANTGESSRIVVEWILSNICNYDCSYCPAYLHNGSTRFPKYHDIIKFCRRAKSHYSDQEMTFLFSGGEITLYPQLPQLAVELHTLGARIALITNGSKSLEWWRANGHLFDEVIVSYHHERADDDHIIDVLQAVGEHSNVQLNVVVDPAAFDRTMAFARRAEASTRATVNRKIMFKDGWKHPAEYSAGQTEELDACLTSVRHRPRHQPRGRVLKGDLLVEHKQTGAREVTALQLISQDLNHWQGWHCMVGKETLFIRFDEIWRSACRVGGRIGSIYDEELLFPREGTVCTASSCNCIAGISATKYSN